MCFSKVGLFVFLLVFAEPYRYLKNILEQYISYKYFLQIFFNSTFPKIFLTNLFEQYISYTYPEISQNLETISPMGPKLEVEWLYIVPIFTFILLKIWINFSFSHICKVPFKSSSCCAS